GATAPRLLFCSAFLQMSNVNLCFYGNGDNRKSVRDSQTNSLSAGSFNIFNKVGRKLSQRNFFQTNCVSPVYLILSNIFFGKNSRHGASYSILIITPAIF